MTYKIVSLFKLIKIIKNFPTYLLEYFGFLKGRNVVYQLRNGLKYKIRTGSTDRFIINEVWLHRAYTPQEFRINPEDIIVDIGAHIGVFTIMASSFAPNGRVYAFEPSKENYELLLENINLNQLKNVEAINKAVSDKDGKIKFYISQTKNKGQNSLYKIGKNQKEEEVEKISFKKFLRNITRIDFVKMDCEGAEYDILYSLTKKELAKIKKISMEYHNYGECSGPDLASFLQKNGFKVRLIKDGEIFGRIYAINTNE